MAKIYGIDLGTTNSIIGCGDTLYGGLVPSVVDLSTGVAGVSVAHVFNDNIIRSFKVNMSLGEEGNAPVKAASLVLKEVIKAVPDVVEKVVITVPAYFTDNERQATRKAANMIGLDVVAIINEPTAAAIYYNRNRKSLSVVYDLGGGTFDVSLIDSRLGNYDVQASDGLVIGGDDLDKNIAKHILAKSMYPHKFRSADFPLLKDLATEVKIRIQKTKGDIDVDLSRFSYCLQEESTNYHFTVETYLELMEMTFKPTLRLVKQLVAKNIFADDSYEIILVGGSTRCPYLRDWIERELDHKCCELTYDPDRIVAQGAAYYAQLISEGTAEVLVSDITKALGIGLSDGTVKNIIANGSKLPISGSVLVTNPDESAGIDVVLYQGSNMIRMPENSIGVLQYDFGKVVPANSTDVMIRVSVDTSGIVTLSAQEILGTPRSIVLNRSTVE